MKQYRFTYQYNGKTEKIVIKQGNLILAIGDFYYKMAYDEIIMIERL